jgi:pimeloyl-ACP methyl ester carboxylesterase
MTNRPRLSRLVLVALTACMILSTSNAGTASAGSFSVPTDEMPCPVEIGHGAPGRALILIQGMFSRGTSEQMWANMTAELADLYGGFIYYTYSGRAHDYASSDTLESIPRHDVPLLNDLITSCQRQGWTSFDIMGHSKGGVIATEYLKAHDIDGGQANLIQHIVTLDAPVNGSELAWLLMHGPTRGLPAPWWNSDVDLAAGIVELAQMYEQRETVIRDNQEVALRLQQAGRCLLTVTNDEDIAISTADAVVEGFGQSYGLGIVLQGDTGRRLGHHRTLDVPNETTELQDIRSCLSGQWQGLHADSEPLSGLRESLSDFVSDAAREILALLPLARR